MKIELDIPEAWVSDDAVLFVVAHHYNWSDDIIRRANRALEDACYTDRLTMHDVAPNQIDKIWIDPAYIAAENWPESAVSDSARSGWVKVLRFDIGA